MEPRTEQPAPRRVLVVDGDPKSLRILEVSLRNEGFEVQVASDATAATAWLAQNVPGLVIAATALDGVDGFEFCRRMKEQPAHATVPFILMGDPTAANRIRGIEIGAEEFVAKPVYVKDVVGRVSLLFQRQTRQRMADNTGSGDRGMAGDLADISIVDLIQTLESNRRSGVVHLKSPQSGHADIYFRQGAVIDAEVGRLSGREAMLRLFSWGQGTYQIELKSIRRKDAIALAPPALVMEGMRRLDEWQRLLKDLPSLQTIFEVDYRLLAERLAEIPDEVNGLLRLFDGTRTLLNAIDECGLADSEALTLAGKLFGEGIIRDVRVPPEPEPEASDEPPAEGWLTEAAGPFRPPQVADEAEATAGDSSDIHRRRTGPLETLESPDEEPPVAASSAPFAARLNAEAAVEDPAAITQDMTTVVPVVSPPAQEEAPPVPVEPAPPDEPAPPADAAVEQTLEALALLDAEPPAPAAPADAAPPIEAVVAAPPSGDAIPGLREDDSAGVIPVSDTPSGMRRTILAAGGIALRVDLGEAAVAGELGSPSARATEPGIGPAATPPSDQHQEAAVLAPVPVAAAGEIAVPPFSESATNWMNEGEAMRPSEALDELGLPSKHRGPMLLIGGAVVLAGLFLGARQWRLAHPEAPEKPVAASVGEVTPPAAPAPAQVAAAPAHPGPSEPAPAAQAPAVAGHAAPAESPAAHAGEHPPAGEAKAIPPAAAKESLAEAEAAAAKTVEKPAADKVAADKPAEKVAEKVAAEKSAGAAGTAKPAAAGAASATASPEFPALLEKCRAAFTHGKMREATVACTQAKDANTESGEALLLLAHSEFNRNHLKEALQWAEKAIKADPNLAEAYVIFGGVQQDAGHNREAKWAYKKYLELAPRGQYATDLRAIVDTL